MKSIGRIVLLKTTKIIITAMHIWDEENTLFSELQEMLGRPNNVLAEQFR